LRQAPGSARASCSSRRWCSTALCLRLPQPYSITASTRLRGPRTYVRLLGRTPCRRRANTVVWVTVVVVVTSISLALARSVNRASGPATGRWAHRAWAASFIDVEAVRLDLRYTRDPNRVLTAWGSSTGGGLARRRQMVMARFAAASSSLSRSRRTSWAGLQAIPARSTRRRGRRARGDVPGGDAPLRACWWRPCST